MEVVGTILSWEGCTRAHPHLTHSCFRGSESGQDTWLETPLLSTPDSVTHQYPSHGDSRKERSPAGSSTGILPSPSILVLQGLWPPQALDNCLSDHQRAGAMTLPLVTSNTLSGAYTFLKKGTFNRFFLRGSLAAMDSLSRPQRHPHHGSPSCSRPWSWLGF